MAFYDIAESEYNGDNKSNLKSSEVLSDLVFSSDGTKMYELYSNDVIYQLNLSTAWDITTATDSGNSYTVQASGDGGLTFNGAGTKLYTTKISDPAVIYEYTLSTAWDLSTTSYTTSHTVSGKYARHIRFSSTGHKLYYTAYSILHQYSLSTNYDLSTLSYDGSLSLYQGVNFVFSGDGSTLYYGYNSTYYSALREYTCSTLWDITTVGSYTQTTDLFEDKVGVLFFNSLVSLVFVGNTDSTKKTYAREMSFFDNEETFEDKRSSSQINEETFEDNRVSAQIVEEIFEDKRSSTPITTETFEDKRISYSGDMLVFSDVRIVGDNWNWYIFKDIRESSPDSIPSTTRIERVNE